MKNFEQEHFHIADKLHTDVLEQKYGPIHAEVLRHDDYREIEKGEERIREARLVDKNDVLRTYALTFINFDTENQEMAAIDDQIREGGLIGATFKQHGYAIKKNVIDVSIMDIPEWMKNDFQNENNQAKARLTEFFAKKENEKPLIYGTVLEVYSPDFRDPADGINQVDSGQINPLTEKLIDAGVPVDEIWKRLDNPTDETPSDNYKEQYEQARISSQQEIESLHKKVANYLEIEKI